MPNAGGMEQRLKALLAFLFASRQETLFSGLRGVRGFLRAGRRRMSRAIDASSLIRDAKAAGILPGDTIMVHSSLSRIGKVENGAETVVRSLVDALTPEGTLLMPCYAPSSCILAAQSGTVLDLRTVRSSTGSISEIFRTWPGVLRSSHPFSSICAWGKHAEYVTSGHDSDSRTSHARSPIARLMELKGKVVGIGVTMGPVSFYHVVEDTWDGFPFPVYREPTHVTYVDWCGQRITRPVSSYREELTKRRIDQWSSAWLQEAFYLHFLNKGILAPFRFGGAASWLMEADSAYKELQRLAAKGITIYLTKPDWERLGKSVSDW